MSKNHINLLTVTKYSPEGGQKGLSRISIDTNAVHHESRCGRHGAIGHMWQLCTSGVRKQNKGQAIICIPKSMALHRLAKPPTADVSQPP